MKQPMLGLLKDDSAFHVELEFSAFIFPSSWAVAGCPCASLPGKLGLGGRGLALRALRGAVSTPSPTPYSPSFGNSQRYKQAC